MNPSDFYSSTPEKTLRFGDVLVRVPLFHGVVGPPQSGSDSGRYQIHVEHPSLAVVMNPCCSLRDELLTLCLLKPLHKKYFKAPKIKQNPLILNEMMHSEDAMPPQQWQRLTDADRAAKIAAGLNYAFNAAFVYASHPLLPQVKTTVEQVEILVGEHEIDFREACFFKASSVKSPESEVPEVNKILQLSDQARELFRNKLQAYYQRAVAETV